MPAHPQRSILYTQPEHRVAANGRYGGRHYPDTILFARRSWPVPVVITSWQPGRIQRCVIAITCPTQCIQVNRLEAWHPEAGYRLSADLLQRQPRSLQVGGLKGVMVIGMGGNFMFRCDLLHQFREMLRPICSNEKGSAYLI